MGGLVGSSACSRLRRGASPHQPAQLRRTRGGRPDRSRAVGLRLGFAADDISYAVDFGLPQPTGPTLFELDPEIKREAIWSGPVLRPAALLSDRSGPAVRLRGDNGDWARRGSQLSPVDSMLSQVADADRTPELLLLREQLRGWRFYDHIRTDPAAPARVAQVGTRTPVLSSDGADLAAALQTIRETADAAALDEAIDHAFPGSMVEVATTGNGLFELVLRQPGMLRPLTAAELSDGTLRYLLWVAALLTPEAPPIVVTHSQALITELAAAPGGSSPTMVELVKDLGQTSVAAQGLLDAPLWHWPSR